jgi:hypothetical protein
VRPDLLPKKDRGKPKEQPVEPLIFGEVRTAVGELDEGNEEAEAPVAAVPSFDQEVSEATLLEGSRVHKRTKEEKLEASRDGKPEHGFRSRMADKTAGFSNKEKLKTKPFMLTRFRKDAGHMKLRSLSAIEKSQKKREGIQKSKMSK